MATPRRGKPAGDLKVTHRERILLTRVTKRMPIDRRYHEERRREQVARQERLRTMMENKFRGSGGDKIDVDVVGQTLGKMYPKKNGRSRSSTYPPAGSRSKGGFTGRVGNRFVVLADDTGDVDDTEIHQGGEMKAGIHSRPAEVKAAEVFSPPVQANKPQQAHVDIAIEEITHRLNNISSPTTYYCEATGEAMSLDFSEIVRGDAGAFTPSGNVSEEDL